MTRHTGQVRIYYEDTDFSGAVYHANYLKFFERSRSDLLRAAGFHHGANFEADDVIAFVVQEVSIAYRRRAGIEDILTIDTAITDIRGARITFVQSAARDGKLICEARVIAACVGEGGRPRRIPKTLIAAVTALTGEG